MFSKLKRLIIGKTLKTEDASGEKLNVFWGLPILSSDAISSVAYAGEEILWVLVPVIGLLAYRNMFYSALAIIFLLFFLLKFLYKVVSRRRKRYQIRSSVSEAARRKEPNAKTLLF